MEAGGEDAVRDAARDAPLILYLDSSALTKLFTDEPGSDIVREAVDDAVRTYTHLITYAEVRAALARALRLGRENLQTLAVHKRELDELWLELGIVRLEEPLIRRAGDLAEAHDLRGYDSVQLAAAEALWREVGPELRFRFVVFDEALVGAAEDLGMSVLGPLPPDQSSD